MNKPQDTSGGSLSKNTPQTSSSASASPPEQAESSSLPSYMKPASPLARAAGTGAPAGNAAEEALASAEAAAKTAPATFAEVSPGAAAEDTRSSQDTPPAPDFVLVPSPGNKAEEVPGSSLPFTAASADDPAVAEAAVKSAAAEAAVADAAAKAAAVKAATARAAAAEAEAEAAGKAAEAAARTEAVTAAVRAKAEVAAASKVESLKQADARAAAEKAERALAAETAKPSSPSGRKFPFGFGRGKKNAPTSAAAQPGAPSGAVEATSFFRSHPVQPVTQELPPSAGSRLFNALALLPILPLTLLLVAQTIFSLDARDLWYSDEIRHANAFQNLLYQGKGIILQLNGAPYPDKPPLYFWFLRGLYEFLRTDGPLLYFAGTALSAVLYLWSTLVMGRLVARFDGRGVLASGLVLLTLGYTMGIIHYARMDLLFSAAIMGSYVSLYLAVVRPRSVFWSVMGFTLAAVATLIKGPLGLALPLASILLFLCWRGTPLRLFRRDILAGFIAAAAILGAWAGAVYMEQGGYSYLLNAILKKQILERAIDTFHHKEPWHYYLVRLPLMLLPWTLIVFFLPWARIFGKHMRGAIAASRTPEAEGMAFLWCIVLSSLALLSVLSGKIHIYLLPALPAVALLMGRATLQLSGKRAGAFRHTLAFFCLFSGIAVLVASLMLFGVLPMPAFKGVPGWQLAFNPGFFLVSAALVLSAFLLWLVLKSPRPEGVLLMLALIATALSFPLSNLAAPSFNAVLSPKVQAKLMRAYMDKGYTAVSFNDYGGTYTYYAGKNITETKDPAFVAAEAAKGKTILAVKKKDWDNWQERPACFTEVHRQWLETSERLLLACPALPPEETYTPETAPAPEAPAKPGAAAGQDAPAQPEEAAKPAAEDAPAAAPGTNAPSPKIPTPAPDGAGVSTPQGAAQPVTGQDAAVAPEATTHPTPEGAAAPESTVKPTAAPMPESNAPPPVPPAPVPGTPTPETAARPEAAQTAPAKPEATKPAEAAAAPAKAEYPAKREAASPENTAKPAAAPEPGSGTTPPPEAPKPAADEVTQPAR